MKLSILTFVFSFVFSLSFAQNVNRINIYFDIDPDNCVSCVSTLSNVKIFETAHQPYYFVLEEKFKSEKEYFQKKYRLQGLKAEYIWNDSLYAFLHTQPGSSITLLSPTGNNKLVASLVDFDSGLAQYFLKKCKLTDTIHFDHEILSPLIDQMDISNGFLFSLNQLRKEAIDVLNINSGEVNHLALTDSISKYNFLHHFNSLEKWQQAAYIELPNNNEFNNFKVVKDTVFAISRHNYIGYVKGDDTGISSFYAMNVFVDGQWQQSYKIDPMSIYPHYYWTPNFNYYNGVFYFSILKPPSNHDEQQYFMAEYKPEGGALAFSKYYDMTLPEGMPRTSAFVPIPNFQNNYFMLTLDDKLYPLNGQGRATSFPMLHNENISPFGDWENFNRLAFPFRIDSQYVWFSYSPKGSKQLLAAKYDLHTQKVVDNRVINCTFLRPILDGFDYNYVYIPIDNKTIVRTHLSTLKKLN